MNIENTTDFGTVKILLLKGEKGDTGATGDAGDYSGLTNKPSINNVQLSGNKSPADLGLATATAVEQAENDASEALSNSETALDATSVIGSGSLDTVSQTIIPAINEVFGKASDINVLWTGANYMASQTPQQLSQNISDQAKGVVLVWSAYENGQAQDYDFVYHFVPKYHIQLANGAGINFFLNTLNNAGHKYIYFNDSYITGYSSNDSSGHTGTVSKIVYRNNYWVLRAVLGV